MARTLRKHLAAAAVLAAVLACAPPPAHAVSKEIIQLQTQVQQLLNMVQALQSSFDSRFGVLQNLAQQTANQAADMANAVNAMQKKIDAQSANINGKVDGVSGQIQSLNDSVDELRTRVDKLQQTVQSMQTQLQNIQTPPPSAVPGTGPAGQPGEQPNGQPPQQPDGKPTPNGAPLDGQQGMGGAYSQPQQAPANLPAAAQAPPLKQTYEGALNDFNAGRYKMATGEFQQVVQSYPYDSTAGSAQFYLGEIAYRQKDYNKAVDAYNAMLETYPGNSLAPTAELHKGYALLDAHRRTDGIRELRLLIQRYPQTPEAGHARSRLNEMGVRINEH